MAFFAMIMAGGTGTRLWPRSRIQHPKQFLDITGDLTMLQQAQQRLLPLIPPENTLVVTNKDYVEIVARQIPDLPEENILGEPIGKGTAPAIGLAAIHLAHRDSEAVMAVLTADHLIQKTEFFRAALHAAREVAQDGWLVTLGINPGYPETGYGYIEKADLLDQIAGFEVYRVARFVEKPDLAHAEQYFTSGNYAWNSGMFIWQARCILKEIETHMPELYSGLLEIRSTLDTSHYTPTLKRVFEGLASQTIDYGVMEKAGQVAMIPVDIGWNDVGSWSAVFDVLPRDEKNNAVVGHHLSPDTRNSLIYSPKRLVATIGLDDFVVVDTEDVLLVCPRSRSQDVRQLVKILQKNGDDYYLKGESLLEANPLTHEQVHSLFQAASLPEKVLLSLLFHVGLDPATIVGLNANNFDLLHGWVETKTGLRPLPDVTRELLYTWMQARNSLDFPLSKTWPDEREVKVALERIGQRAGVKARVPQARETLARALFETSPEGSVIRDVLGEEAMLVRVPLEAQFPFSLQDFTGNENNALGEKAKNTLNRAVKILWGFENDENDPA